MRNSSQWRNWTFSFLCISYIQHSLPPDFILWIVTFPIFINKNLKWKLDWPNKQFVFIFLSWNHINTGTNFYHLDLAIKYCSRWKHVILSCIITKSYCNMPFCYSGFLNHQQIYSYLTLRYCWGVMCKGWYMWDV